MAVKGKTKGEILAAFERRLEHDGRRNSATALAEIDAIAALRLEGDHAMNARLAPDSRPSLSFGDEPRLAGASALTTDRGRRRADRERPHRGGRARRGDPRAGARRRRDRRSRGKLVLPGFIDTHIHYPQTRVIGSYGAQLLDWLRKYTFVEEQKFARPRPCRHRRALFSRRIVPSGHDDRDGLLHRPSGIGRRLLRREPSGAARG